MIRTLLCFLLGLLLWVPAQAQISIGENLAGTNSRAVPDGVNRYGEIEVTVVSSPVDGRQLFKIASPTVYDREQPKAGRTPVEKRARDIDARLELVMFERQMDAPTMRVETAELNNVTVITVRDKDHPRPLVLASVIDTDANFHGVSLDDLAERWRRALEQEIRSYNDRLEPENLLRLLRRALVIVLTMLGSTGTILLLKRRINSRQRRLRNHLEALEQSAGYSESPTEAAGAINPDNNEELIQRRDRFIRISEQRQPLKRSLGALGLLQWLLFWSLLLIWYVGIYLLLRQFPVLAALSGTFAGLPLNLLAVWFFTTLAMRFCSRLLDRVQMRWEEGHPARGGAADESQRLRLRFSTIVDATRGMLMVVIVLVGVLAGLSVLGIPNSSILAIGGLLGLAISFGAQNLIRDLVNGLLILAEDQFAIGDVITAGGATGLVEQLNLRVTQLRSAAGEFITIPNSTISQVQNLTRNWSRVNVSVDVDCDADPLRALAIIRETGQQLHQDPAWSPSILAAPEVLGIDAIDHSGLTITTWINTAPGEQWKVSREFQLRLLQNLRQAGIRLGSPRQTNITADS